MSKLWTEVKSANGYLYRDPNSGELRPLANIPEENWAESENENNPGSYYYYNPKLGSQATLPANVRRRGPNDPSLLGIVTVSPGEHFPQTPAIKPFRLSEAVPSRKGSNASTISAASSTTMASNAEAQRIRNLEARLAKAEAEAAARVAKAEAEAAAAKAEAEAAKKKAAEYPTESAAPSGKAGLFAWFAKRAAEAAPAATNGKQLPEKFKKMRKMGIPVAAVRVAVQKEGLNPDDYSELKETVIIEEAPYFMIPDGPQYNVYRKKRRAGMSNANIKANMKAHVEQGKLSQENYNRATIRPKRGETKKANATKPLAATGAAAAGKNIAAAAVAALAKRGTLNLSALEARRGAATGPAATGPMFQLKKTGINLTALEQNRMAKNQAIMKQQREAEAARRAANNAAREEANARAYAATQSAQPKYTNSNATGKLPKGWLYVNDGTDQWYQGPSGNSQWERPDKQTSTSNDQGALPSGWLYVNDGPDQWYAHSNGRTSWTRPKSRKNRKTRRNRRSSRRRRN